MMTVEQLAVSFQLSKAASQSTDTWPGNQTTMADKRYLFHPPDAHFMRPPQPDAEPRPLLEEVLVDPDAEIVEGEKPETKKIEVVRSFGFWIEQFIISHPIFDNRRGYDATRSSFRIMDAVEASTASKTPNPEEGNWIEFEADDVRKIKKVLSTPPTGSSGKDDDRKSSKSLSAADMREMSRYETKQYRACIESVMNPRRSPPSKDEEGNPKPAAVEGESW
jgi:hypothetical protein